MLDILNKQEHTNDCFRAAAATILLCDMADLPDNKGGVALGKLLSPRSRWQRWARRNGYQIHMSWVPPKDTYYIGNYRIAGHTEATVHAVVCYNQTILHNPARTSYPLIALYNAVWFTRED